MTPFRPIPDDFAECVARMSGRQLREHYRTGLKTLRRWLADLGSCPGKSSNIMPIPASFREYRLTGTQQDAATHFGVARTTVRRWDRALGIRVKPIANAAPRPAPQSMVYGSRRHGRKVTTPVDRAHVDISTVGRAADHLRRFGAVYRCRSTGAADPKGTHWRRGNAVLTDDELIQRAERQGFVADAWKVAA